MPTLWYLPEVHELGNRFREGRRANRYSGFGAQSWLYIYIVICSYLFIFLSLHLYIYICLLFLFETWRSQAWQSLNRTWRSQAWQSKLRGRRQRWQSKTVVIKVRHWTALHRQFRRPTHVLIHIYIYIYICNPHRLVCSLPVTHVIHCCCFVLLWTAVFQNTASHRRIRPDIYIYIYIYLYIHVCPISV